MSDQRYNFFNPNQVFDFVGSESQQAHKRQACCNEKCLRSLISPCGQLIPFQINLKIARLLDYLYAVDICDVETGQTVLSFDSTSNFFDLATVTETMGFGDVTQIVLTHLGLPDAAYELPVCRSYEIKFILSYDDENGSDEIKLYSLFPFKVVESGCCLNKLSFYHCSDIDNLIYAKLPSGKRFVQCLFLEKCKFSCQNTSTLTQVDDEFTGLPITTDVKIGQVITLKNPLLTYSPIKTILSKIQGHSNVTLRTFEGDLFDVELQSITYRSDFETGRTDCFVAVDTITFGGCNNFNSDGCLAQNNLN